MSSVRRPLNVVVTVISVLLMTTVFTGCGKGSKKNIKVDGVSGPYINYVDNTLTLSIILKKVTVDYGARIPVPYMPHSYMEVGPDFQSNGYMINIGIAPEDIKALTKDGIELLDPQTLPGGRAIPGIAEGILPSVAVQVPKLHNIVFYVGDMLLGLFIPINLPWQNYIGTFRFYDGTDTPIGNISIVGKDEQGLNSGLLMMINLKGRIAAIANL